MRSNILEENKCFLFFPVRRMATQALPSLWAAQLCHMLSDVCSMKLTSWQMLILCVALLLAESAVTSVYLESSFVQFSGLYLCDKFMYPCGTSFPLNCESIAIKMLSRVPHTTFIFRQWKWNEVNIKYFSSCSWSTWWVIIGVYDSWLVMPFSRVSHLEIVNEAPLCRYTLRQVLFTHNFQRWHIICNLFFKCLLYLLVSRVSNF